MAYLLPHNLSFSLIQGNIHAYAYTRISTLKLLHNIPLCACTVIKIMLGEHLSFYNFSFMKNAGIFCIFARLSNCFPKINF